MDNQSYRQEPKRGLRLTVLIIAAAVILLVYLQCCTHDHSDMFTQEVPEPTTPELEFVPAVESTTSMIEIPVTSGIVMEAGQLTQKVDFYNPEDNKCFFVLSLFLSDNTLLYESDMLSPGDRIEAITLYEPLERGIYSHCRLVYSCYALDAETPLNGSTVVLEINSR